MTYDPRCYDLACVFLEDDTLPSSITTEAKKDELAQLIQTTIEDYIAYEQSNYEPPDPPGFEGGFVSNH